MTDVRTATPPVPPTTARPAAASAAIRHVLTGPSRPVRVVAVFPAATYLVHDDGVVALVAADGVRHPNALVVADPVAAAPFAGYRVHEPGTVGDGELVVAGRRTVVTRWFDPVPRLPDTTPAQLAAATAAARHHLEEATGPVPDGLAEGVAEVADALADADVTEAVAAARGLVGLGPGMTPAGDDCLAGLLTAVSALDRPLGGASVAALAAVTRTVGTAIADHARHATTAISAALLAHAARGEVAAPAADLLHALAGRGPVAPALDRLLAVGATSGRDLAIGLLAGADLMATTADRLAPAAAAVATHGPSTPRITP